MPESRLRTTARLLAGRLPSMRASAMPALVSPGTGRPVPARREVAAGRPDLMPRSTACPNLTARQQKPSHFGSYPNSKRHAGFPVDGRAFPG